MRLAYANGTKQPPNPRKYIDIEEAYRLYGAGNSHGEIAKILGCSAETVRSRLGYAGVYSRPRSTPIDIDIEEAYRLYGILKSYRKVAEILNCSAETVRSKLKLGS